ncbi:hypothetical protein JXB27_04785 [Candidatus Woesearchaeota archaeon]|nr:hypothetical protein [Candidatus Woesearchaeota archaeon]
MDLSWLMVGEQPWYRMFNTSTQLLGVVVAFMISYLGFKAYRLTRDKKYKYFFIGFFFMGASFLANAVLNIIIQSGNIGYFLEKRYEPFIAPLFGGYYFLLIGMMLAYVSLAILYSGAGSSKNVGLFYFWALVIGAYSFKESVLFNTLCGMILSFVVLYSFDKYRANQNKSTLLTYLAFFCLFLFHALVWLQQVMPVFLIVRQIILLLGLVMLLAPMLRIFYGRKKK